MSDMRESDFPEHIFFKIVDSKKWEQLLNDIQYHLIHFYQLQIEYHLKLHNQACHIDIDGIRQCVTGISKYIPQKIEVDL